MKVLEGQLEKDTSFNHKAKELMKIHNSAGEQITKLEKQRTSLELRYFSHIHPFFPPLSAW
jgi:hypothetical protein